MHITKVKEKQVINTCLLSEDNHTVYKQSVSSDNFVKYNKMPAIY